MQLNVNRQHMRKTRLKIFAIVYIGNDFVDAIKLIVKCAMCFVITAKLTVRSSD